MKKMKNKLSTKLKLLSTLPTTIAICLLHSVTTSAVPQTSCDGHEYTFPWECDKSGSDTLISNILMVFNWLAVGVGTVVIIMVIIGAIQYMTASGAQERAKKGIETIRNALLALVLYMVMWALLNFLVPGGLFA